MPGGEPEHPPTQERGPVELVVVRRESGAAGVPATTWYPCAPINLDGKQPIGPGEIEPPAPTEVPRERVFRDRFLES